ncbi:hypothetical protein TIFTF001_027043 [Ficus carica]|uniref:DUF4005 domain-containing protein n=1 Tax=Ficus carica TaxID=3494 RepID=A0AA88IXV1_FICCA|nr:hypothetical protein TIFTF001_027043 [Ficus carica]
MHEFSGDHDKHAIAVLAATAAVADAAVAAAQAAADVVRLTSALSGGGAKNHPAAYVSGSGSGIREELAPVKIQSAVRGRLAQARAIGGRSHVSEFHHSTSKSSNFHNPGPATLEKFEHSIRSKSRKHDQPSLLRKSSSRSNGRAVSDHDKTDSGSPSESQLDERSGNLRSSSVRNTTTDDKKSDRILEINTGKPPHITPKRRNLFHSSDRVIASDHYSHSFTTSKDSTTHHTLPSPSSYEVQPLTPLKLSNNDVEEGSFCTANNSRQLYSASSKGASSRRGPFMPSKSDGSRSFLSGYSDYPKYMACTES